MAAKQYLLIQTASVSLEWVLLPSYMKSLTVTTRTPWTGVIDIGDATFTDFMPAF